VNPKSLTKYIAPLPFSANFLFFLNLSPDQITCWHYYPTKLDEQLPDNITVVGLDLFDPRA